MEEGNSRNASENNDHPMKMSTFSYLTLPILDGVSKLANVYQKLTFVKENHSLQSSAFLNARPNNKVEFIAFG